MSLKQPNEGRVYDQSQIDKVYANIRNKVQAKAQFRQQHQSMEKIQRDKESMVDLHKRQNVSSSAVHDDIKVKTNLLANRRNTQKPSFNITNPDSTFEKVPTLIHNQKKSSTNINKEKRQINVATSEKKQGYSTLKDSLFKKR